MTKSMKLKPLFYQVVLIILAFIGAPGGAWAANISYKIQSYGSKHAVINLSGAGSSSLSITPSNDGQQVRISGVEVGFVSDGAQNFSGIVSDAQQVRRGAYTDLVLSFRGSTSISATPGTSNLKLFVRLTSPIRAVVTKPTPSADQAQTPKTPSMPIRLLQSIPSEAENNKTGTSGLTIVFPSSDDIRSPFTAASELRQTAYILDLLWAWTFNSPFTRVREHGQDTGSNDKKTEELDILVQDLTKELVEVRKELMAKEEELRSLRGSRQ